MDLSIPDPPEAASRFLLSLYSRTSGCQTGRACADSPWWTATVDSSFLCYCLSQRKLHLHTSQGEEKKHHQQNENTKLPTKLQDRNTASLSMWLRDVLHSNYVLITQNNQMDVIRYLALSYCPSRSATDGNKREEPLATEVLGHTCEYGEFLQVTTGISKISHRK